MLLSFELSLSNILPSLFSPVLLSSLLIVCDVHPPIKTTAIISIVNKILVFIFSPLYSGRPGTFVSGKLGGAVVPRVH